MASNGLPGMTTKNLRELIYGLNAQVQHGSGKMAPAINLDNAATTPPFKAVVDEIARQMCLYGSIGRGTGQKSRHSSVVYEEGRKKVLDFVGADRNKYSVIYTNNTTDGINKLASALTNPRDRNGNLRNEEILVISTRMEHHSNDLPWRERAHTEYAEVDAVTGRLILEDFERILKQHPGKTKYVTVTAASNVTGYVNDVHSIARIAHKYGAKIIVDGAQIVAHRKFSMLGNSEEEDVDFFVFSAHKMYSPYGGGALVGLKDVLNDRMPQFYGGGMVSAVCDNAVVYANEPDLYESGSPNVPGVFGMLKAIEVLESIGFDYIQAHEQHLLRMAIDGLSNIPGVFLYGDNENIYDRVGILVFNIEEQWPEYVANELAFRAAISVRHAAFCAHPYVRRLEYHKETDTACRSPVGMVRVSFGIYTTEEDIDTLIRTVKDIADKESVSVFSQGTAETFRLPLDRG